MKMARSNPRHFFHFNVETTHQEVNRLILCRSIQREGITPHSADEKRFGSLASCTAHTIKTIHPTIGINQSSRNHPLLSVSCSRRAPTAREGSKTAKEKSPDNISLTMPDATDARKVKRNHHQYSDREARPSNVAYFEKQVLMDLPNVMSCPLVVVCGDYIDVAFCGFQ